MQSLKTGAYGKYVVAFSYKANAETFSGTYRADSPQASGHTFEILYDPEQPSRNTGSDAPMVPWVRNVALALGIGLTLTAIWLWGDEPGFSPLNSMQQNSR